jgi:hypothetical protein
MKHLALTALTIALAQAAFAVDTPPTATQLDFFEKKIRPVLADKCYKCHSESAQKIKGGLVLDTREGIRRGGDSGPAVVPGDVKESILAQAIAYTHKEFAMPPEKEGGKLPAAVIADFDAWIKMGAPDPRDGAAKVVTKTAGDAAKQWWAYQPLTAPVIPQSANAAWAKNEIDRFVAAAQQAKGLKPMPDAEPATLFRRMSFALTGLPPSPAEVGAFLREWPATTAPNATAAQDALLAKWTDQFLARPQFGEHWARHWLDVARYAESSGRETNVTFPHAWRYRDYVIGAFNADKGYDTFVREQIAGDLLPYQSGEQRAEQLVATGFLALGSKGLNEQNARQFWLDVADEQIDAVSQAFLGVTVACARCHDHKHDPISQREYYAMAGIFLSTDTRYGTPTGIQNRHPTELVELPAGKTLGKTLTSEDRAKKEKQLGELRKRQQEFITGIVKSRMANKGDGDQSAGNLIRVLLIITQIGNLEAELKGFDASGKQKPLAMGVQDLSADRAQMFRRGVGEFLRRGPQFRLGRPNEFSTIDDAPLYARGDSAKPGEKVTRGFPVALTAGSAPAIPRKESGRKQLADWIVSPGNPMTARVYVNRVWHWLFGRGIVESVDNFGTTGKEPDNQALLDYLARRFSTPTAEGGFGWSTKRLIREIVLSRTFRLSSDYDAANFAKDPENTQLWRANKRRLEAESIRDAMLSASGQLDLTPLVGSFIARSGDAPIGGPGLFGVSEQQLVKSGGAFFFRSVYLPATRDVPPDALAVFDFVDANMPRGARETTNVPAQALYLLNSDVVTAAAQKLAGRLMQDFPSPPSAGIAANLEPRIARAYWLVLGRAPTAAEKSAAWNFFQKFPGNWSKGDTSASHIKDADDARAAWTSFSRALFATADFRLLH